MKIGPASKKSLLVSSFILLSFFFLWLWDECNTGDWCSLFQEATSSEKEGNINLPGSVLKEGVYFDYPIGDFIYLVEEPKDEYFDGYLFIPDTLGVGSDERLLL